MRRIAAAVFALALLAAGCSRGPAPLVVGAVYPTGGPEADGGMEEYRGAVLAADYLNAHGGVLGRPVRLDLAPANSAEAAPAAVRRLTAQGTRLIVGSYGSTISAPAAAAAVNDGAVFWETGAVGHVGPSTEPGTRFFRVTATGGSLGSRAVAFVQDVLLPSLHRHATGYAVAYVRDVYGSSVGEGAIQEVHDRGLRLAGAFPYDPRTVNYAALVRQVAHSGANVLVVAAYLHDGIALRREVLRQRLPLAASIGTSSSYCMPDFGKALGTQAIGLFASDKPDADVVDAARLAPDAGAALRWARDEYARRWGEAMEAHALSGFSGVWALLSHVVPRAGSLDPRRVSAAARAVHLPEGSLPNGNGLAFGPPGSPNAGENLMATSVIWEWVAPNDREVVWPRSEATHALVPLIP